MRFRKGGKFQVIMLAICFILACSGGGVALPGRAGWLKTYGTPEEILVPNNYTVAVFNGTTGKEEGRNVLYATSKGKPGHLNVIDLEDYKLAEHSDRTLRKLMGTYDGTGRNIVPCG